MIIQPIAKDRVITTSVLRALAKTHECRPFLSSTGGLCRQLLADTVKQFSYLLPKHTSPIRAPKLPQLPEVKTLEDVPKVSREEVAAKVTLEENVWDPAPLEPELDAGNCRALLLEILRRASYDWVLYRDSSKLENKKLAEEAYIWLFEEDENSASYKDRIKEKRTLTAFVTICEIMDMDPDVVRSSIKKLTIKSVLSVGRPAERRRPMAEDGVAEDSLSVLVDIDLDSLPSFDPNWG